MVRRPTSRRVSFLGRLGRPKAYWRANSGSAAVEFAMVAMPFFALLGGVIELGLIFMAQVTLDNAMQTVSRTIRTGQDQSATTAALQQIQLSNFRNQVCDNMEWMISDCKSNLTVTIDNYSTFAAVPLTSPVQNGQFNLSPNFNTGGPQGIEVVRAYYQWTLFFPNLNQALERVGTKTVLTSVTTFANEPFTSAPPTSVTPQS